MNVFGNPPGCDSPVPASRIGDAVLPPHDVLWRMHEDADGNGWYPGEAPR